MGQAEMFTLKDIVTWTHPRSGKTHTGVIVRVYHLNDSERYVVQVWRQRALRGAGVASVGTPPAPLPTESCVAEEIALTPRYYSANIGIS